MPSEHLRQVDFPAEQVTFHSHSPDGQELGKGVSQLNQKKENKTRRGFIKDWAPSKLTSCDNDFAHLV